MENTVPWSAYIIKWGGKVIGAIGKNMFDDIERAEVLSERLATLEQEITTFREQIRDLFQAKYSFGGILGMGAGDVSGVCHRKTNGGNYKNGCCFKEFHFHFLPFCFSLASGFL